MRIIEQREALSWATRQVRSSSFASIEDAMASIHIVHEGYVRGDGDRVGSTVGLVVDGDAVVVVDPGMVAVTSAILDPLRSFGFGPRDVTDVVLSHHHPDHTMNAGLFPAARVHDHWAVYRGDVWTTRRAEGFAVSPAVTLLETPGHSPQDVTTLVRTDEGLVAFTHLWWSATTPVEDPYAPNPAVFHANRERVLSLGARTIVPGHGAAFEPDDSTPR